LELNLNATNILPVLKDENKNYYYRIPFPKGKFNSFILQYITNIDNYNLFGFSLTKNSYPFSYEVFNRDKYYNIPIDKEEIMKDNNYINLYGENSSESYINIIQKNEFYFGEKDNSNFRFSLKAEQINKKNKLNITFHSYSYYSGKKSCKYYFLINCELDYSLVDIYDIYSYIYGKSYNTSNHQIVLDYQDDGSKGIIQYELDIPIDLDNITYRGNRITILYFDEESLIFKFLDSSTLVMKIIKEKIKRKKMAIHYLLF
jgi:hypothetical protein